MDDDPYRRKLPSDAKHKPFKWLIRILLITIVVACLDWLYFSKIQLTRTELIEGMVTDREILAPYNFPILKPDDVLAEEKAKASRNVAAFFKQDTSALASSKSELDSLFKLIETNQHQPFNLDFLGLLSTEAQNQLLHSEQRKEIQHIVNILLDSVYVRGVVIDKSFSKDQESRDITIVINDTTTQTKRISELLALDDIDNWTTLFAARSDEDIKSTIFELLTFVKPKPNLVYLPEKTKQAREKAGEQVPRQIGYISRSEKIIGRHEKVTQEHLIKLKSLAIAEKERLAQSADRHLELVKSWGYRLILVLLILALGIYIRNTKPRIYYDISKNVLIALLLILQMGFSRLVLYVVDRLPAFLVPQPDYLIPVALVPILATVLLDIDIGIFMTLILGLLTGLFTNNMLLATTFAFVPTIAACYSIRFLRHRYKFFLTAAILALGNALIIVAFAMYRLEPLNSITKNLIWGTLNGLLTPMFVMAVLPAFEYMFKIVTDLTLLEYADLSRPLLQQLLLKAPGTYNHSILVSNLAEIAASSIGANQLLVRVGAYYHDLGKIKQPKIFAENRTNEDMKLEKMPPEKAAKLIRDHINEGLRLVKESGIPQPIADFIPQHHGTSIIRFFYEKMRIANPDREIDPNLFRYPGPKPQSKEAAILMIADACEAASHSLDTPTIEKLQNIVNKIVTEKLEDKQFSDCDITLREIEIVSQRITQMLQAIYHSRPKYPEKQSNV